MTPEEVLAEAIHAWRGTDWPHTVTGTVGLKDKDDAVLILAALAERGHRVSKEPDFTDLIGELYQLAGAVLMAGDHYTTESEEELGTLLLDVLAAPDEWTADMVHAEWKARAVPSGAAQIQAGQKEA